MPAKILAFLVFAYKRSYICAHKYPARFLGNARVKSFLIYPATTFSAFQWAILWKQLNQQQNIFPRFVMDTVHFKAVGPKSGRGPGYFFP